MSPCQRRHIEQSHYPVITVHLHETRRPGQNSFKLLVRTKKITGLPISQHKLYSLNVTLTSCYGSRKFQMPDMTCSAVEVQVPLVRM